MLAHQLGDFHFCAFAHITYALHENSESSFLLNAEGNYPIYYFTIPPFISVVKEHLLIWFPFICKS